MRIRSIDLSWFRGASEHALLDTEGKSIVIYGSNGSGKSSFVDAIEHVLCNGRIKHLAHEYSGKRQEKAIINTHKPITEKTSFSISFIDGSLHTTQFHENGSFTCTQSKQNLVATWKYEHTVLRQTEVAEFIQSTKGDKYSALLPLLGLQPLETIAENLRKLAKSVEQISHLIEEKRSLAQIAQKRIQVFGNASNDDVLAQVQALHTKYCSTSAEGKEVKSLLKEIEESISTRINASSTEQKSHYAIADMASIDLNVGISSIQFANKKMAGVVEPFIKEKLSVIESTSQYITNLKDIESVDCPACGREIQVETFRDHIKNEQDRLAEIKDAFDEQKSAIALLCNSLEKLCSALAKDEVRLWSIEQSEARLSENFKFLEDMDIEVIRKQCNENILEELQAKLLPIINAACT